MTTLTPAPSRKNLLRRFFAPSAHTGAPQPLRAPQFMESLEPRLVLSSPLAMFEPTVRINPIQVSIGENAGFSYIVATRTSLNLAAELNVSFDIDGSASLGSDYKITSIDGKTNYTSSFTFKAGVAVTMLKVQANDDVSIEGSENISFNLTSGTGYQLDVNHSASLTITDNEPTVKVVSLPVAIQEKAGFTLITVLRAGGNLSSELEVPFSLAGSASLGTDFKVTTADGKTTLTDSFTFKANSSVAVLKVQAIEDAKIEGSEYVTLSLGKSDSFGLDSKSSTRITIIDNEPTVKLNPLNVSINENLGFTTIVATRTGSLKNALEVDFDLSGSASLGSDFKITSLDGKTTFTDSFAFSANSRVVTLKIQAIDDTKVETSESLTLSLKTPSGEASFGLDDSHSVSVTIKDNEPVVKLNPVSVSINENLGFTTIVATRTGSLKNSLDVSFDLSGSATLGSDFKITSLDGKTTFTDSFTFSANAAVIILKIQAIDDTKIEGSETLGISIVAGPGEPNYNIDAKHSAGITIADNEAYIKLSPLSISLGEAGKFAYVVATRVGGNLRESLDVSFSLSGDASFGTDYKITSVDGKTTFTNAFTFNANAAVTTLKIQAIDDTSVEGDEHAGLTLTAPVGASYSIDSKASVSVTLIDDEPTVRMGALKSTASENLATINKGLVTITRSLGNLLNPLDVEFTITGDADINEDYQLRSLLTNKSVTTEVRDGVLIGKVTFPRGVSILNLTVGALPDKDASEGTESVTLKLIDLPPYAVDDDHDDANVDIYDGKSVSLNIGHIGSSLKITTQASLTVSAGPSPSINLTTAVGAGLSATGRDAAYTYTYLSAGSLVNRITFTSLTLEGLPLESAVLNLNFNAGTRPETLLNKTILFLPAGTAGADGTFTANGVLSVSASVTGAFRLI